MRKGILVANGSLQSEKFEELYRMFDAAAGARGVELVLLRNTELALPVGGCCQPKRSGAPAAKCAGAQVATRRDTGHTQMGPERTFQPVGRDETQAGELRQQGGHDVAQLPKRGDGGVQAEPRLGRGETQVKAAHRAESRDGAWMEGISLTATSPVATSASTLSEAGEKKRARRRGLLFGAGGFGGMTLFGGAVSGLPGEESVRAVRGALAGEKGCRFPARAAEEETAQVRSCGARCGGVLPPALLGAEFVLFWDKDVRLARALERAGLRVANSARAILLCDDKRLTHEALAGAGLPMPKTVMGPLLFGPADLTPFADALEGVLSYPVVVKEAFGSFGAQVYLAENRAELLALCGRIGSRPFLVSEFIKESAGRDLRLQVVGGRVVAAMERRARAGDFRAGLTGGGTMHPFAPDPAAEQLAVEAAAALGCDFAGVDLLFGREGYLVCEVNSNAHFKNLFDLTGVNAAEPILDHLLGC